MQGFGAQAAGLPLEAMQEGPPQGPPMGAPGAPPPYADLAPSGLFPDLDPMSYVQQALALQQQGQSQHQMMASQAMMQAAAQLGFGQANPYDGGAETGIPYEDLMPS